MTDNASVPVYKLYGEHQQWATPDMIHCETIAARSKLHNWEIKPHQHHGLFQILYLREGNARLRIEEREHPMSAGQLLLVPQMCVHGFQFAPNAQGHVITLAYPLVRRAAGAAGVSETRPRTGSEDFGYFAERVPGLFVFLGVRPKASPESAFVSNHSPKFFADEAALPNGVKAMMLLATDFLQGGAMKKASMD